MIGKKINQLATELAPTTTDLTIIGDPVTGVSKKITLEQLGAIFGGAVSFYTTLGDFPVTGVIDIIYCAKDTKKLYLWSGSAYVEVFPSQSLLDTYQLRSEKGVSNGYASLDVNGKVPIGQLPNSIMEYKGTWNAATNTPTLANGTGDTGDVYICNVAGTVNFGAGPITFAVGDYVVYSGTIWQRSSGAVGTVTSVSVSNSGDALAITGSPITTSGTINIGFAGTGAQYIKGDGTLATFPSIISQAQNLITEVYNNTGATLTKGTIVYINGGQGNLPTVTKALATSDATSAQTYGVVQTDITNMNNGYVVVEGRLSDLDTQAYANGTQLYLSPTTAGTWTSTKPYAPNHLVYVGIVVRSHPTQGVVEVKIMNGFEMDELHNVAAQSPDNNDILQYKTATSLWTKVAGTTSNIAEGSNLYYTDARSRAALSFTAGSGAYNSTTGVITIPTNTNQLTNGAAFITLASLSAGAGISYNNTTGVIASTITQYTDALARAAISLTTTGTSGAATYNNTTGVLNIPQYQTALTNPVTGTGTTNTLVKFTGSSTIGNSIVSESGSALSVAGSVDATIANLSLGLKVTGSNLSSGTGAEIVYSSGKGIFLTFNRGAGTYLPTEIDGSTVTLSTSGTPRLTIASTGAATFSSSVSLTSGFLSVDGFGNKDTNYITMRSGFAPSDAGGIGFKAIDHSGSGTDGLACYGHDGVSFYTAQTERMRITSGGNVGIGTSSPLYKLDVNGIASLTTVNYSTSAENSSIYFNNTYPSNYALAKIAYGTDGYFYAGYLSFSTTSQYQANVPVERMRITQLGNVGIGTTSPSQLLEVANASGTVYARLTADFGSGFIGMETSDDSMRILTAQATPIQFYTNNTERMRITSGGNVGIGTTSPQRRLHVTNSMMLSSGSAAQEFLIGDDNVRYFSLQTPSGAANLQFNVYGGSNIMTLTSGGNVEINTGSIKTGEPDTGWGRAAIKIGASVSGAAFNVTRYLPVNVDGTVYFINLNSSTP